MLPTRPRQRSLLSLCGVVWSLPHPEPAVPAGLRFGLPDHLTTTGQASGQANYYMVKQVAKTTSWSGVGGQASGPANFRRGLAKNFACGARNPGGRPPGPPAVQQPYQTPNRSPA